MIQRIFIKMNTSMKMPFTEMWKIAEKQRKEVIKIRSGAW